jgi:cell division septation protein DedD
MSWQPNGRHYSFNRDEISACAPAVSGVYGLYNRNYQLLIGESENIQESLLRHLNDEELRSRRYRPTDFSFETCLTKLRKQKAIELIESFRPILQTHALSTDLSFPLPTPVASEPAAAMISEPLDVAEEFPVKEIDSPQTPRWRFFFERSHGVRLVAMFAVTAAVSFYLGIITGENIQRRANLQNEKPQTRIASSPPSADQASVDGTGTNIPAVEHREIVIAGNAVMSTKQESAAVPPSSAGPLSTDAQNSSGVVSSEQSRLAPAPRSVAIDQPAGSAESGNKWSVQISAAPSKDIAANLVQRLKTNGHEGYIVQAEVKGQTYFRVRIGHFAAQEEADSLRQMLAREEGYSDAFLARD